MFEFAKRGLYVGLGLANLTKEKVESFAEEFAKQAKLSEEEGKKFAEYLQTESKKASAELKQNVDNLVEAAVNKLPCNRVISRLEARIAALEKAVGVPAEEAPCCCGPDADAEATPDETPTEADEAPPENA